MFYGSIACPSVSGSCRRRRVRLSTPESRLTTNFLRHKSGLTTSNYRLPAPRTPSTVSGHTVSGLLSNGLRSQLSTCREIFSTYELRRGEFGKKKCYPSGLPLFHILLIQLFPLKEAGAQAVWQSF